jgi:DNA-binding transcriptional MerR regulator
MAQLEIPNRSLFRQPEVCEIASIQPYVLRTWEAEFPDLGIVKADGGARVYRRADVERVLRIKQLLYGEGLTLAGVRRKLVEERPSDGSSEPPLVNIAELFGKDARERLQHVKRGLRELSSMLSRPAGSPPPTGDGAFELRVAEPAKPRAAAKSAKPAPPTKKRK